MIVERFEVKSIIDPSKVLLPKPGVCSSYVLNASSIKFLPHASAFKALQEGNILMVSHGISLTPLLSVLETLSNDNFKGKIELYYGVSSADDFMFYDELNNFNLNLSI